MITEDLHTLVLGAGPAALTAAYRLAKAGIMPVVLEKDKVSGGLMRSMRRGDFIVDIGRKELYNRIPEVDRFWSEILGNDYRSYLHRVGILYNRHIIEMSPSYRGFRRGMPWGMLLALGIDFLWWRAKSVASRPRNIEEHWYYTRGRRMSQILVQGYQEKFRSERWAHSPLAEGEADGRRTSFFQTLKEGLIRTFASDTSDSNWWHPARGTGQICECLEQDIVKAGGCFKFEARVVGMASSHGRVSAVTAEIAGDKVIYRPLNVVSSIPIEHLGQLLLWPRSEAGGNTDWDSDLRRRSVVLVYLFIDEQPRFPHAYLKVTCPKMKAGRITNYAAFSRDMVPNGQTCLCVEFFCVGPDPLLELSCEELRELALEECSKSRLVDRTKCFDHMVLKLPGADAATSWRDWISPTRLHLMAELKHFENLYDVNRAGTDVATYAGIKAADAILSGDRTEFDEQSDPTRPVVRKEAKPFEFSIS